MGKAATSKPVGGKFAAVTYAPKSGNRDVLLNFIDQLKETGIRVGGIIQETFPMPDGEMRGVDIVDIATGRHIPINRPTREEWDNRVCSLDTAALAEASVLLNQTIEAKPDLIVIEKFGSREKKGKGLSEEIFRVITTGVPLLIAVPETLLDIWTERTGGMGKALPLDQDALLNWWSSLN